ncbi:MAG TPA: cupredoxin family copper-binding protein [Gemmatimonadales bacterium]|nr:cupredoxin family copper-binding protein [Gemmatimonadales bacterium]
MRHSAAFLLALATLPAGASIARAQSLLDRSPNISGMWVPARGVVQFNFLHRFSRSPAPERKVTGFPAFTIATGLPARTALGFVYATNSTVVPSYPNEWELFARAALLDESGGAPADVGVQAAYNLASEGLDGELSAAKTFGRARLLGVVRALSAVDEGDYDVAAGGGAVVRITSHVALAGDAVALLGEIGDAERVAWSAGLHLAIPGSPHTLSLHASNAAAGSLQGSSRAGDATRFGFEFTVPLTLARYFGSRAPVTSEATVLAGDTVRVSIAALKFAPAAIVIEPGTTVIWQNDDPIDHTVTATGGAFDSGLIRPGASWTRTFSRAGTFDYACTPHPVMRGRVTVREAS